MFFAQKVIIIVQYICLGILQGITEPLPISSSGHTILFKDIFHISTPGLTFEIVLHLGSLVAIIFIYRRDLIMILHESMLFIRKRDQIHHHSFLYVVYLLLATAVTGIIGILLEDFISNQLASPITVAIALLVTGSFLWHVRHMKGAKQDEQITMKDAIIIGCAQALALIPGISRSGATLVAGLMIGFKRETAIRFSFLLFIPVSIGMHLVSIPKLFTDTTIQPLIIPYILAFLTAMIATYYVLQWFKKLVLHGKLVIFSFYCFIVGIIVLFWQL